MEDLAVVVLGHELGHAYTHQGADIEGHRWPTGFFTGTAPELLEGLAQYFTVQICRRVGNQCPNAERAYEVLLQHQPGPYHEQEKWASYRGEEIRLALLRCRRSSHPETHDQLRSLLDQAKFELRGAPEDTQTRLFARGEE